MPRRTAHAPAPLVKAYVAELEGEKGGVRSLLEANDPKKSVQGFLDPPFDPAKLVRLFESSSGLRPNIDHIATNVDASGHIFEPALNLNAPDAKARLKMAMLLERLDAQNTTSDARNATLAELLDAVDDVPDPTEDEVEALMTRLRRLALVELHRLRAFFSFANPEGSFSRLRQDTRTELEIAGNAYWEVLRNPNGQIARLVHVPMVWMRLTKQDPAFVEVSERVRVSDIHWKTVKQLRQFRRFVQITPDNSNTSVASFKVCAYFKEFGDPRILSQQSGKFYPDVDTLKREEPESSPATEILHFKLYCARSPYGVPRWMGNLPGVLGSRELDQVNESYFDNKAVPPLAILVNGGRMGKGTTNKIAEFFRGQGKGIENFHRVLVIEAEQGAASTSPTAPNIVPKIQIVPLREAQQTDGLFQKYDDRNLQKLAYNFRLSVQMDNEALQRAEAQVFRPMRNEFDETMNRQILPELGVVFWRYKSLVPTTISPEAMARVLHDLSDVAVITPSEAREVAETILNRELPAIEADWAKKPLAVFMALLRQLSSPGEAANAAQGKPSDPGGMLGAMGVEEEGSITAPDKPSGDQKPLRALPSLNGEDEEQPPSVQ